MKYVPVLKAREAEIEALGAAPGALDVTPLFELQAAAVQTVNRKTGQVTRTKSSRTDASYFLDDIARLWSKPLYLDVCRVAPVAARDAWWSLLAAVNALSGQPAQVMPVVSPLEPSASRAQAARLAATVGRAALRVQLPHANPATLAADLSAVAADLGIATSDVDVVLDWQDQMEASIVTLDHLEAHTSQVIAAFGGGHGDIITVGTPNSAPFQQAGDWDRTRREWWLWLRLAHSGADVTYGDYALYPPASPAPVSPNYGHLRYSSDSDVWVHRRARLASGGGLSAAFAACCAHLVGQPHFLGAGFSAADEQIDEIASGTITMGAPGQWRRLAADHHFALVANQLAAPPAAPPRGTP